METNFNLNYIKCPECDNTLDLSYAYKTCPNPLCGFQFEGLNDWLDKDDGTLQKAFIEAYKAKNERITKLLITAVRYNMAKYLAHFITCDWGAHYNTLFNDFIIKHLNDLNALKIVLRSDIIEPGNSITSTNGYKMFWELYGRLITIPDKPVQSFLRLEFPAYYKQYYQQIQDKFKENQAPNCNDNQSKLI